MLRDLNYRQSHTHPFWARDIAMLTFLFLLLFGTLLNVRPLGVPDEARYAEIPREMIASGNYITPRLNEVKYFEKPALFYWMEAAAIKAFGLNEWVIHIPNALLALLGCLITYATGRVLFDRRTGLFSSIVLATSVLYFAMGHIVTIDMAVTVFLSGALFCFLMGQASPLGPKRRYLMWGMYAFAALATLTKGLIGIIFPGMIIAAWMLLCHEWRILKSAYLVSGIIIFAIIAVPWHFLVQHANPEFFHYYFIDQQFYRYLTHEAKRGKPSWFFIATLLIGFFPWIVFLGQTLKFNLQTTWKATWQSRRENKEAWFLLLWAILIFIFFSLSKSKLVPYILPIFPPLALLTGRYLASLWQTQSSNLTAVKISFSFIPLISLAVSIGLLIALTYHPLLQPNISNYYVYSLISILIGGTLTATLFIWRSRVELALTTLVLSITLFMLILLAALPFADTSSIKPLAMVLTTRLQPADDVIAYKAYYQDLPYYLQRRVTVVDMFDELTFGTQQEDTSAWMIDEKTLWQRWHSAQTLYMIIPQDKYMKLKYFLPSGTLCLLAQTRENVLVMNKKDAACQL